MSMMKKKALLECGCGCGGCGGCCWAADPNDPSQALPIQFDVDAPLCTELNTLGTGNQNTFTPQESLTGVARGACGPCTWMLWNDIGNPPPAKFSVGGYEPGDPLPSPCGWQIAAALVCLAPDGGQAPTETTDPCCMNVRLLMAADNEFSGSIPLTDFTTLQQYAAYAEAAQALIDGPGDLSYGKLKEPASCSCDEVTGMHGEFDASEWVTPSCPGGPGSIYSCCEPTLCGGAITVVF